MICVLSCLRVGTTVNPRISAHGAYLVLILFGWELVRRGLIKLLHTRFIKSSLSKFLFFIILKEESKFMH